MDSGVLGAMITALLGFVATITAVVLTNAHNRKSVERDREYQKEVRFHDLRIAKYAELLRVLEGARDNLSKEDATEEAVDCWIREMSGALSDVKLLGAQELGDWADCVSVTMTQVKDTYHEKCHTDEWADLVDQGYKELELLRAAMRFELGIDPRQPADIVPVGIGRA